MDSEEMRYSFECDVEDWGEFFTDACEEIEYMQLWDTEEVDDKVHEHSDGCMVYCGNSYMHRVELLYGTGTERFIPFPL